MRNRKRICLLTALVTFLIFLLIPHLAFAWVSVQVKPVEVPADGKSKADIEVHVVDENGEPVEGASVALSLDPDYGSFKKNPITTDKSGNAYTKYRSSKTPAVITITAESGGHSGRGQLTAFNGKIQSISPIYCPLDKDSNLIKDIVINYVIEPIEYSAKSVEMQIFKRGIYTTLSCSSAKGQGEAKWVAGSNVYPSKYKAMLMLNKGSKSQFKSKKEVFYVFKVELDTKRGYVEIGKSLQIKAKLRPSYLSGGIWEWQTVSPTCGSGNFTATNPTIFTGIGEGCVYPRAIYKIGGESAESYETKKLLVYKKFGKNTRIKPISNPIYTYNPPIGFCRPYDPTLEWAAYFDKARKKWYVRVTSLDCTGIININIWPASGTPNPVPGGNVTETNYKDIIADLADYASTGGAGPVWHHTDATRAHEEYHWYVEWMRICVRRNWRSTEKGLENLSIPEDEACKANDAKIDLQSFVDSRYNTFLSIAWSKWSALPDGPGDPPYLAGQKVLNRIIRDIKRFARENGWK